MNTAEDLAYITSDPGCVLIEINGGFGDAIQLRSAGDVLIFLAEVVAKAEKCFGVPFRVGIAGKVNVAPYTWADHQATLDEIAAFVGVKR
jgi:hypothetical protein